MQKPQVITLGLRLNQLRTVWSVKLGISSRHRSLDVNDYLFIEWPYRGRQSRTAMADEPLVGLTDQVQYPLATPSRLLPANAMLLLSRGPERARVG